MELDEGVVTFVGMNGQGKTNLVEAVEYISTLGSHRVSSDLPLIRSGTDQAIVRTSVVAGRDDPRVLHLELEINARRANRAKVNRALQSRPRDILGILRTVVFSPEDLAVIKSDPATRRRWMDHLVVTRWPRMAGVRSDYDKVLSQRSALLKSAGSPDGAGDVDSTLDVWNDQLARIGAELMAARLDTLADLWPHVERAYAEIAPTNNLAHHDYRASVDLAGARDAADLQQILMAQMQQRRVEELRRGVSLVGPHRDDVEFSLGDLPAKGYASHGESWSYALALRLAARELLRADGIEPVLVLDDVFAELDSIRRDRLAERIADAEQVLITAAVAEDVPAVLSGQQFRVADRTVTREQT